MILAIDVGNTITILGVYEGEKLIAYWRVGTEKERTSDEIGMLFINLFNHEKLDPAQIKDVIIASVAPSIMYSLEQAIRKYFKVEPMIVGPGTKTGINIKYEPPREVGADKIVNAVAAYEIYGGPIIIVDFGTATTFCAISSKGEYLGGTICPGIRISAEALFQNAAKLPRIDLVKPARIIGRNVVESMQAGIVLGYVGLVDYIVNRMKSEMKEKNVKVIATGGLAELIGSESSSIDKVNTLLTLEGLRIIYDKNK